MAEGRRLGSESSEVRTRFIDAAEAILAEQGEHGLSARLVAARAGLKTQLLYYYFRTMDDLLLAVVHRVNERRLEGFEQALASPDPLRAMWTMMTNPNAAALASAVTVIAQNREQVRPAIIDAAREFRALQTRVVERLLPPPRTGERPYSAAGIVMIAASLARMLVNESSLGLDEGHAEARAIVEDFLHTVSSRRPPEPATAEGQN